MMKLVLLALAICLATAKDDHNEYCDGYLRQKCNDKEPALVEYAVKQRGCVSKMCTFRPKKGLTHDPEKNFYAKLQPSRFTKEILYSFDTYKARTCAIPNQMCSCRNHGKCKCHGSGKFCRQQYRTESGMFLVMKPQTPKLPVHIPSYKPPYAMPKPHPKPAKPYAPQYPGSHYPPPQPKPQNPPPPPPPPSHQGSGNSGNDHGIYQIPSNARSLYFPSLPGSNEDGDEKGSDYLKWLLFSQMTNQQNGGMGNGGLGGIHMFSLLKGLGGNGGKDNTLKYLLFSQLLGQGQQYGGHHPPMHAGDDTPDGHYGPGPQHGQGLSPAMLYYMMSQKSGSSSNGMLQMLPFIMGNGGYGANFEMKTLYISVPDGCECEGSDMDHDSDYSGNPLLEYFMQQQYPSMYQPSKQQYFPPMFHGMPPMGGGFSHDNHDQDSTYQMGGGDAPPPPPLPPTFYGMGNLDMILKSGGQG